VLERTIAEEIDTTVKQFTGKLETLQITFANNYLLAAALRGAVQIRVENVPDPDSRCGRLPHFGI